MSKQIVIINGTGGCGKDTFVQFCANYTKVLNFSSIDKVKEVARIIGWDGKKEEKDRKFLSDLKKLTTKYNDMAFNSTKDAVIDFLNSDSNLMFIHIREPEEILRTKNAFNCKTLLIKREGYNNIESNDSDKNVNNFNYDFIIINDTLEQLEKDAKDFVNKLVLEK